MLLFTGADQYLCDKFHFVGDSEIPSLKYKDEKVSCWNSTFPPSMSTFFSLGKGLLGGYIVQGGCQLISWTYGVTKDSHNHSVFEVGNVIPTFQIKKPT